MLEPPLQEQLAEENVVLCLGHHQACLDLGLDHLLLDLERQQVLDDALVGQRLRADPGVAAAAVGAAAALGRARVAAGAAAAGARRCRGVAQRRLLGLHVAAEPQALDFLAHAFDAFLAGGDVALGEGHPEDGVEQRFRDVRILRVTGRLGQQRHRFPDAVLVGVERAEQVLDLAHDPVVLLVFGAVLLGFVEVGLESGGKQAVVVDVPGLAVEQHHLGGWVEQRHVPAGEAGFLLVLRLLDDGGVAGPSRAGRSLVEDLGGQRHGQREGGRQQESERSFHGGKQGILHHLI